MGKDPATNFRVYGKEIQNVLQSAGYPNKLLVLLLRSSQKVI